MRSDHGRPWRPWRPGRHAARCNRAFALDKTAPFLLELRREPYVLRCGDNLNSITKKLNRPPRTKQHRKAAGVPAFLPVQNTHSSKVDSGPPIRHKFAITSSFLVFSDP